MSFVLTDEQKVKLTLAPKTAAGNAAVVDGTPSWSSSDPSIVTLEVADDGLSAYAVAVGALGMSQVSAVADADMGDSVREITAVLDVEVKASEAVVLGIEAGAAEPKG